MEKCEALLNGALHQFASEANWTVRKRNVTGDNLPLLGGLCHRRISPVNFWQEDEAAVESARIEDRSGRFPEESLAAGDRFL